MRTKRGQVKHISDHDVKLACALAHAGPGRTLENLMRITGAPWKVAYRKIEQCYERGLVEIGVSVATAWWIGDTA